MHKIATELKKPLIVFYKAFEIKKYIYYFVSPNVLLHYKNRFLISLWGDECIRKLQTETNKYFQILSSF